MEMREDCGRLYEDEWSASALTIGEYMHENMDICTQKNAKLQNRRPVDSSPEPKFHPHAHAQRIHPATHHIPLSRIHLHPFALTRLIHLNPFSLSLAPNPPRFANTRQPAQGPTQPNSTQTQRSPFHPFHPFIQCRPAHQSISSIWPIHPTSIRIHARTQATRSRS